MKMKMKNILKTFVRYIIGGIKILVTSCSHRQKNSLHNYYNRTAKCFELRLFFCFFNKGWFLVMRLKKIRKKKKQKGYARNPCFPPFFFFFFKLIEFRPEQYLAKTTFRSDRKSTRVFPNKLSDVFVHKGVFSWKNTGLPTSASHITIIGTSNPSPKKGLLGGVIFF